MKSDKDFKELERSIDWTPLLLDGIYAYHFRKNELDTKPPTPVLAITSLKENLNLWAYKPDNILELPEFYPFVFVANYTVEALFKGGVEFRQSYTLQKARFDPFTGDLALTFNDNIVLVGLVQKNALFLFRSPILKRLEMKADQTMKLFDKKQ